MSIFNLTGFAASSLVVGGGGPLLAGSSAMLDPSFAASTDRLSFAISDDDALFNDGTDTGGETGQTALVTNSDGQTVAAGQCRDLR
jgi:hypothetical protein